MAPVVEGLSQNSSNPHHGTELLLNKHTVHNLVSNLIVMVEDARGNLITAQERNATLTAELSENQIRSSTLSELLKDNTKKDILIATLTASLGKLAPSIGITISDFKFFYAF